MLPAIMHVQAEPGIFTPHRAYGTKPKARLAWWAALLLLCCFPVQGALRFDVFIGYDGTVPEASWFPVTCEIYNDEGSFNAIVEISPGQFNQGQVHRIPVELPTGTTKRFVIPVFASSRGNASAWDARLLDERGRVRLENLGLRPRKQQHWRIPIVAAVSRTALSLPNINEPGERVVDWQPGIARLQPSVFPENPLALEGLKSIYLNSEKALDLKVNQVNALLSWLNQGGHLVVGVDQVLQVNGNEWLRQILPCELTGLTSRTDHREIQEWLRSSRMYDGKAYPFVDSSTAERTPPGGGSRPVRRGTTLVNPYAGLMEDTTFEAAPMQVANGRVRDGTVLIGSTESPLAVIAARGRGQISLLMFSPELEPFVQWKHRPWFWAKMLGIPPELFAVKQINYYGGYSIDAVLGAMIDTKQVRKLPVGWLLLLLVGYLLVIGPIDQYWLKKINRQMWTWLTFPAYVAAFSVLIYIIGYKLRAGETEWNELHIVDVVPIGEKADIRGRTFATVYSPANARYKLGSEQPFAALRGEYQRGQESSKATVVQTGNSFSAEVSVPVWTSQLYVGDWMRRDDPPLTFSLSSDNLHYYLQINNSLDKKLTQPKLVIDDRVITIPQDLPPNQMTRLTLPRNSGQLLGGWLQNYGNQFQTAAGQRQQAFGGQQRHFDITNSVVAASFISQWNINSYQPQPGMMYNNPGAFITVPGFELSPLIQRGDGVLLAWAPNFSLTQPMNKFSPRRTHRDTVIRIAAHPQPIKAEN